jgi:hypothetical protein
MGQLAGGHDVMTDEFENKFTPKEWERIRAHIRARGMTFEVFLPEHSTERVRARLANDGMLGQRRHPNGRDQKINIQATPDVAERLPRRSVRHRTGRNQQLNIKATTETIERFYKLADERRVALGELLEHALDALEKSAG